MGCGQLIISGNGRRDFISQKVAHNFSNCVQRGVEVFTARFFHSSAGELIYVCTKLSRYVRIDLVSRQ